MICMGHVLLKNEQDCPFFAVCGKSVVCLEANVIMRMYTHKRRGGNDMETMPRGNILDWLWELINKDDEDEKEEE